MENAYRNRQQQIQTALTKQAIPIGIRPNTAGELRELTEQHFARSIAGAAVMPGEADIRSWLSGLKGRRPDLFQSPESQLSGRDKMTLGRALRPAASPHVS